MCGIAGILRTWPSGTSPPHLFEAIPEVWLDILDDTIKHRGPDGTGRFRHRVTRPDGTIVDIALVHRRLSIIDHTTGHQPMVLLAHPEETPPRISREGSPYTSLPATTEHHICPRCADKSGVVAVAFNGCVYNHRELRQELETAGHEFFSDHSDTEVLLHGWREWGQDLVKQLDAMHALAIWDGKAGTLFLGRDAFGEKPLYIATPDAPDAPFFFSSNMLGLAMLLDEEDVLPYDDTRLIEWIRFGYDAELCPLARAMQVGHGDLISAEELRNHDTPLRRDRKHVLHPDLNTRVKHAFPTTRGFSPFVNLIDDALDHAVAQRLEADVPLGCLLSGGVDSSLIAHYANLQLDDRLTTICVRMPDERYDESAYAQHAAECIGTRHLVVDADPNPAEDLLLLIQTLGLPFGDSSLLPTWWACRAAAREVKVLLSGDGGDELFLGYERYKSCEVLDALNSFDVVRLLARVAAMPLSRKDPKSKTEKAARLLLAGAAGRGQSYRELLAIFPKHDADRLFAFPRFRFPSNDSMVEDAIDARHEDLLNHLPGDMLRKVDTASMLAGVEVRAPFLDRRLAGLALGLPNHRLMPRGQRKGLLRAVARRYFPSEIIDRPKMGFAIPLGEWFRSDYGNMRQLLYDHLESTDPFPGLAEAGIEINMHFVRQMLREHDAAGEQSRIPWHGRDHTQRLYMVLVLSIWCRWMQEM